MHEPRSVSPRKVPDPATVLHHCRVVSHSDGGRFCDNRASYLKAWHFVGGDMMFKLNDRESVVTAYAESASGPGWGNSPVWVIVRDGSGLLRQECIQPDEQNDQIGWLYAVSQQAHLTMTAAVTKLVLKKKNR